MDLRSALLALLPAATLLGAWYALRPAASGEVVAPLRLAAVRAAVLVGAYAVVGVEALSALDALNRTGIVVLWILGLAAAGTAAVLRYRRSPRPARLRPALPRWSVVTWLMVAGLVAVAALTLAVALVAAPNNWDSQSYHLPRVEQWVQRGSVGLFPANFFSLNDLAPGAEFMLLHLRLLTGGDRLYNLVQWSAALVCALAVSRVAAQLGAKAFGQVAAAFAFVSAPMVVLQATSTQTDLVASAWAAAVATLAVDAAWGRPRLTGVLLLGAAAGLAQNTKATGMLAAWPMAVMWLVVRGWQALRARSGRSAARLAGSAVVLAAVALVITGPFVARMTVAYGNPLGPPVVRAHSMQRHDPPALLVNGLRLLQVSTMVPWHPVNTVTEDVVERVAREVRVNVGDPLITEGGRPFPVPYYPGPDEDLAAFPLQVVAAGLAIGYCLLRRRRDPRILGYALTCLVVLCAFVAQLKWQLYVNRLLLPGLVLTTPLIGLAAEALVDRARRPSRTVAAVALAVVVVIAGNGAIRAIAFGAPRALVGTRSVFTHSSWSVRFARMPQMIPDYDWAGARVRAAGARRIGLVVNVKASFEYPLWLMFRGSELVNLVSDVPGHPAPAPDSVDAIVCEPAPPACAPLVPPGWTLEKRTYLTVALPPGARD